MSTSSPARRPMLLNPLWLQGVILTFVIGFAILFYLAVRIYQDHAPVPGRIVSESGETFLTEEDILQGQEHFLTYGLMQYGTVYGHGAYRGPDFTADYLHRAALHMQELYGGGDAALNRVRKELRENRYDPETETLVWTEGPGLRLRGDPSALDGEPLRPGGQRRGGRQAAHDRGGGPVAPGDRLHRLDRLDGHGAAARQGLLLHQQLAPG